MDRHTGNAHLSRLVLVSAFVVGSLIGQAGAYHAVAATNIQEGDNSDDTDQEGEANSGDAVAGQVVGVVSSGDTRVDATNRTEDSDAESGDAQGSNTSASFVGHLSGGCPQDGVVAAQCPATADVVNLGTADNVQEGDNENSTAQSVSASSGDAVAGQVVGVVTAGTADVVVANTTIDSSVQTGDADALNDAESETGLRTFGDCCDIPGVGTADDVVGVALRPLEI